MAPKAVYVVYDENDVIEVQDTKAHAEAAVQKYQSTGATDVEFKKFDIKQGDETTPPKEAKAKATKAKASKEVDSVEPEDDEALAEEEAPKKKKAASKKAKEGDASNPKKTIPDGQANALQGLKFLFTGTMSKDRTTCEATATKYGGKIVTKIELADYVVLGTKPGDNKVKAIEQHGLETIDEDTFFEEMIKTGIPQDKLDRMGVKAAAKAAKLAASEEKEPAKKKQKK